jgi:membrane-associated phospholipid phosphatase
LDDPYSEYRDWWHFIPNLAGSNDDFKSWPSGNMTVASMMFALPLLAQRFKKHSSKKNMICFTAACIYVIAFGYNRIHMTNHFLSDVCFGTLITYLIHAVIAKSFQV